MKLFFVIPAIATTIATLPALLSSPGAAYEMTQGYDGPLPPDGYQGRRWTHPNGCAYTLAGRPGERVWYLIINASKGKACVSYFVEKSLPSESTVTRGTRIYE